MRAYYVNGQCLVSVDGMEGTDIDITKNGGNSYELGLTDGKGQVVIMPNYKYHEINYDEWGTKIPPNLLWMLAGATITMTLVHFDQAILKTCIAESAGGGTQGVQTSCLKPMGAGKALGAAGNHYITLHLSSPGKNNIWKFYSTYLANQPVIWPLGVERSLVKCVWRAIPYSPLITGQELRSRGALVWSHT